MGIPLLGSHYFFTDHLNRDSSLCSMKLLQYTHPAGRILIQTIATEYNCRATCDLSKQLTPVTSTSWREIKTTRNGVTHLHTPELKCYSHRSCLILEHASEKQRWLIHPMNLFSLWLPFSFLHQALSSAMDYNNFCYVSTEN